MSNDDQLPTMTTDEIDGALFGPTGMESVAKPVSIRLLWADIKQPRRIFPQEVRGDWAGSPQRVPELLRAWHQLVVDQYGAIDATKLVLGNEAFDVTNETAIVTDYFRLCQLAAGIAHEGLTNAITVTTANGGNFNIETGERRWLAHHLLVMYGDNRFDKIMARIVNKFDIYRQASENTAREPLNAVGTARQLALILIHMHDQQHIENWEMCVPPGHCDRNYYVQAANLDIVRNGSGRVYAATGIEGRSMVSRYKAILTLPDELWLQADDENWTENRCREALKKIRDAGELERKIECKIATDWIEALAEDETRPVKVDDVLPVGNIGDEIMPGDRITTKNGFPGLVDALTADGEWAEVWIDDDDETTTLSVESLNKIPECKFFIGDRVETKIGLLGEITGFKHQFAFAVVKIDGEDTPRDIATETLTMRGRNTVTEPVAGADDAADYGEEIEHGFEIDNRVVPVTDPLKLATVIEIEGNRIWVKFDNNKFGEAGYSSEFLMSATEDNQESGDNYVEPYVPETNEDATSIVSVENPGLSKILNALSTYFHLHEELDIDIEWSLDDLMISRGQLEHELDTENNLDKYINDMDAIRKNLRLYLHIISGVIDDWCMRMGQVACEYVEGGDDDES